MFVQDRETKRKLQTTVNKRVRVGECESKRAREKVRGEKRKEANGSPSKIQIKLFWRLLRLDWGYRDLELVWERIKTLQRLQRSYSVRFTIACNTQSGNSRLTTAVPE